MATNASVLYTTMNYYIELIAGMTSDFRTKLILFNALYGTYCQAGAFLESTFTLEEKERILDVETEEERRMLRLSYFNQESAYTENTGLEGYTIVDEGMLVRERYNINEIIGPMSRATLLARLPHVIDEDVIIRTIGYTDMSNIIDKLASYDSLQRGKAEMFVREILDLERAGDLISAAGLSIEFNKDCLLAAASPPGYNYVNNLWSVDLPDLSHYQAILVIRAFKELLGSRPRLCELTDALVLVNQLVSYLNDREPKERFTMTRKFGHIAFMVNEQEYDKFEIKDLGEYYSIDMLLHWDHFVGCCKGKESCEHGLNFTDLFVKLNSMDGNKRVT